MNGLLVAGVCFVWLTVFTVFARREYRTAMAELKDAQVPAIYGHGWMTDEDKHTKALNRAYSMIYAWPVKLIFGMFDWLITTKHLLGVPDSETDPWSKPEKFRIIDAHAPVEPWRTELGYDAPAGPWPEPWYAEWLDRDETDDLQLKIDEEERRQRAEERRNTCQCAPPGTEQIIEKNMAGQIIVQDPTCPCGYRTECPIHCGDGHENGRCPARAHPEFQ